MSKASDQRDKEFYESLEQIQGGEGEEAEESNEETAGDGGGQETEESEQSEQSNSEGGEEESGDSGTEKKEEEIIQTDEGKQVTLGRFNEINNKYQEERDARIRIEENMKQLQNDLAELKKPEKPKEEIPNEYDEPEAYEEYTRNKQITDLQNEISELKEDSTQRKERDNMADVRGVAVSDMQKAVADGSVPDAFEAFSYLKAQKELEQRPFSTNEKQVQDKVRNFFTECINGAQNGDNNVAEIFKALAINAGYKPGDSKTDAGGNEDKNKISANLDAIERNKDKGASTSTMASGSGNLGTGAGNVRETLAAMREKSGRKGFSDDFHKYIKSIATG